MQAAMNLSVDRIISLAPAEDRRWLEKAFAAAAQGYWEDARRWISMVGFSNYLATAILNHVFRTTKYTAAGTVYVALHDTDPTDAALASTELAAGVGAYARAAVAVSDAKWTTPAVAGSTVQISNADPIQFPSPTAHWNNQNPIDYASIWDAPTLGNMLCSGALGTPRSVLVTDNAPVFGSGSLVLSLT